MPDYLGDDQRKTKEEDKEDAPIRGNKHRVKLHFKLRTCLSRNAISYTASINC